MKNTFKNIIKKLLDSYRFYRSTRAYEKVYRKVDKDLLLCRLDKTTINNYKKKWGVFGKPVEIKTFLLCYNLSGKIDLNIVPRNLFATIIEKRLNPHKELVFLELKNSYNRWFSNKNIFPKVYFHKIDGIYYDDNYQVIERLDDYLNQMKVEFPLILKPSKDTAAGKGVKFIRSIEDIRANLKEYDFLVCQEMIHQHSELAQINNSSINSVRVCLYRTDSGCFDVLNCSIRFGVNGSLDNTSSGGISCNILEKGFLNEYALDDYANKCYKHPNSEIEFKTIKIPFYEELVLSSKNIANEILLCNLVSLDMCLDNKGSWRCIETNLLGQTISFSQYAGKGFFGDYTDEVIKKTVNKVI